MKKLLSTILASSLILSMNVTSFATEQAATVENLQQVEVNTLSSTPEHHFEFLDGIITKYTGTDKEIVIPSHINGQEVIRIGSAAFWRSGITSVVVPDTVLYIDGSAFQQCSNLVSVTLPASLYYISLGAFSDCGSLAVVNYGGDEASWYKLSNVIVYKDNTNDLLPTSVKVNLGNEPMPSTSSYGRVVSDSLVAPLGEVAPEYHFDFTAGIITKYKGSASEVIIPSTINGQTVTQIANNAFWRTTASSVVIPDTVSVLDEGVFNDCDNLRTVTIPSSVEEVSWGLFYDTLVSVVNYEGSETEWDKLATSVINLDHAIFRFDYEYLEEVVPKIDTSAYPEWAQNYVAFIAPTIMTDISTENYGTASNRGLIAQSLYNMLGNGAVASSHGFVDGGNYDTAIAWCKENSVMNGTSSTEFGTESNVTREQFALILQKAGESLGKTTTNADEIVLSVFNDEATISSWARGGMAWAVANGLMSGNNNNLNPQGNITRTEVAVMLYNFDKL